MSLRPLFKYAGGKTRLMPLYEPFLPEKVDVWVEPFLGGGAPFAYAYERWGCRGILSDIDPDVVGIYRAIQTDADEFIREYERVVEAYLSIPEYEDRKLFYYDLRKIHAYEIRSTDMSAWLLFLMKTCFNGMYQVNHNTNERFGTPCGALAHTSKEQLFDDDNIRAWNEALQRCSLFAWDWRETRDWLGAPPNLMVFCDPPYRGAQLKKGYSKNFTDEDRSELIKWMRDLAGSGGAVAYTDRDCGDQFFCERQGDLRQHIFHRSSTIGRGAASNVVAELLLHNKPFTAFEEALNDKG